MPIKLILKVCLIAVVVCAAVYPVVIPPIYNVDNEQQNVIKVKQHSPIIKISPLPDFAAIRDVKQKKKAFFGYLTPYVEQINREIFLHREFILHHSHYPSHSKDVAQLNKIANKYRVDIDQEYSLLKQQLLLRADQLPLELVLMQAANESAWGTSRFALKANNLFGQWCFRKGCGVVPEGRPSGKTYEVRKFKHPIDSIRGYFHNLNTGYAYEDLRLIRMKLRQKNKKLDPMKIADGLLSYSTRREAYITELKQMIRVNRKYIKNSVDE